MKLRHPHPAKALGCTPAQVCALDSIAMGDDTGIARKTGLALAAKGLVHAYEQPMRSGSFTINVYRYEVPVPVHMAWCQWGTEQCEIHGEEA